MHISSIITVLIVIPWMRKCRKNICQLRCAWHGMMPRGRQRHTGKCNSYGIRRIINAELQWSTRTREIRWQINTHPTGMTTRKATTALANKRWWEGPTLLVLLDAELWLTKEPRRRCRNGIRYNIPGLNKRSIRCSPNMAKITTIWIQEERRSCRCPSYRHNHWPSSSCTNTICAFARSNFSHTHNSRIEHWTEEQNSAAITININIEGYRTRQPCLPSFVMVMRRRLVWMNEIITHTHTRGQEKLNARPLVLRQRVIVRTDDPFN